MTPADFTRLAEACERFAHQFGKSPEERHPLLQAAAHFRSLSSSSAEDAAGVANRLDEIVNAKLASCGGSWLGPNDREAARLAATLLRSSSAAVAEAVRVERRECQAAIDRIDLSSRVPGEYLSGMREGIALAVECIRACSARAASAFSGPRCGQCDERPPCDAKGCAGCTHEPKCGAPTINDKEGERDGQ